jgi:hypothetical protein
MCSLIKIMAGVYISSCFFHFSQIIWRRVQVSGNTINYKEDENFKLHIKMIVALAFVPDKNIPREVENLLDFFLNTNVEEYIVDLLVWFEEIYVKNTTYKFEKDGMKYYTWSIYKNVVDKVQKTSNSIEGWHRSLKKNVNKKNPSLVELFKTLQFVQNNVELSILQSLFIDNVDEYESCDEIFKTCLQYEKYIGVEYVLKIALLLKLKYQ